MAAPIHFNTLSGETRSTNIFNCNTDERAIATLNALELLYWNEWETACRFEDSPRQNLTMRRISLLQDLIKDFKEDALGR